MNSLNKNQISSCKRSRHIFFFTDVCLWFNSGPWSFIFINIVLCPSSVCVCVCVCVCVRVGLICEWARLHGNGALAAVARAIVLIHTPDVLIYCENESETGRPRERERWRERANNYVSPFVSAPSIKPEERQPEHMSTYPLKTRQQ